MFIEVYSRMGEGNRECWKDNLENCTCPACEADKIKCVSRVDDDFDCTYCTFTFEVPKQWEPDFKLIISDNLTKTSDKYKDLIVETFPKSKTEIDIVLIDT